MDIASVIHNFITDIASAIIFSGYVTGFYMTIECKKKKQNSDSVSFSSYY